MQSRKSDTPDYQETGQVVCNYPEVDGGKLEHEAKRSFSDLQPGYCESYLIFDTSHTECGIRAPYQYITAFFDALGNEANCSVFVVKYDEMQDKDRFNKKIFTEGDGTLYSNEGKSHISREDLHCLQIGMKIASEEWKVEAQRQGDIQIAVYGSLFGLVFLGVLICFIAQKIRDRQTSNQSAVNEKTALLQNGTKSTGNKLSAISSLFGSCFGKCLDSKNTKENTASINTPSA